MPGLRRISGAAEAYPLRGQVTIVKTVPRRALAMLLFGWPAARCGSVLPCVICHALLDATGTAIALAARLLAT